jgi:lysylphosphatidylglycerol synthetase-like protein (DUF2156 family)
MSLFKPPSSVEVSVVLAAMSGMVSSLVVVVGNAGNSHRVFWIGVVGFALLVTACTIERIARPHQQWIRFVTFAWSVGATMGFAIAAAVTAIHAFGSTAMYVWLVLAGISCGLTLLVRPPKPYPVEELP